MSHHLLGEEYDTLFYSISDEEDFMAHIDEPPAPPSPPKGLQLEELKLLFVGRSEAEIMLNNNCLTNLKGRYVRFNSGVEAWSRKQIWVLCEVTHVDVGENIMIDLSFGRASRLIEGLDDLSDDPPSQLEFEQWKSILQSEHSEIPTKADLQDRLNRQLILKTSSTPEIHLDMDPPAVRTPTPLTGQPSPSLRSPELPDDNWRAHQVPIYTPSPVTRKLQLSPWKARYLHDGGRHRDVIIKKRHDHKASKDDRKAERRALRIEPRRFSWASPSPSPPRLSSVTLPDSSPVHPSRSRSASFCSASSAAYSPRISTPTPDPAPTLDELLLTSPLSALPPSPLTPPADEHDDPIPPLIPGLRGLVDYNSSPLISEGSDNESNTDAALKTTTQGSKKQTQKQRGVKRKRKVKETLLASSEPVAVGEVPPKPKRGRSSKTMEPLDGVIEEKQEAAPPVKKKTGRPRKRQQPSQPESETPAILPSMEGEAGPSVETGEPELGSQTSAGPQKKLSAPSVDLNQDFEVDAVSNLPIPVDDEAALFEGLTYVGRPFGGRKKPAVDSDSDDYVPSGKVSAKKAVRQERSKKPRKAKKSAISEPADDMQISSSAAPSTTKKPRGRPKKTSIPPSLPSTTGDTAPTIARGTSPPASNPLLTPPRKDALPLPDGSPLTPLPAEPKSTRVLTPDMLAIPTHISMSSPARPHPPPSFDVSTPFSPGFGGSIMPNPTPRPNPIQAEHWRELHDRGITGPRADRNRNPPHDPSRGFPQPSGAHMNQDIQRDPASTGYPLSNSPAMGTFHISPTHPHHMHIVEGPGIVSGSATPYLDQIAVPLDRRYSLDAPIPSSPSLTQERGVMRMVTPGVFTKFYPSEPHSGPGMSVSAPPVRIQPTSLPSSAHHRPGDISQTFVPIPPGFQHAPPTVPRSMSKFPPHQMPPSAPRNSLPSPSNNLSFYNSQNLTGPGQAPLVPSAQNHRFVPHDRSYPRVGQVSSFPQHPPVHFSTTSNSYSTPSTYEIPLTQSRTVDPRTRPPANVPAPPHTHSPVDNSTTQSVDLWPPGSVGTSAEEIAALQQRNREEHARIAELAEAARIKKRLGATIPTGSRSGEDTAVAFAARFGNVFAMGGEGLGPHEGSNDVDLGDF